MGDAVAKTAWEVGFQAVLTHSHSKSDPLKVYFNGKFQAD